MKGKLTFKIPELNSAAHNLTPLIIAEIFFFKAPRIYSKLRQMSVQKSDARAVLSKQLNVCSVACARLISYGQNN